MKNEDVIKLNRLVEANDIIVIGGNLCRIVDALFEAKHEY